MSCMGAPCLQRSLAACPADLRVATPQAQRDHQVEKRLTRLTMMNDNRQIAASRGSAYAATIPITNQNRFAQPAEVFLILPPERVAGRTEAQGEDLLIPAPTIKCPLYAPLHCSTSPCTPRLTSVSIQPSFQGAVLSSAKGMPFTRASPPASKSKPHVLE